MKPTIGAFFLGLLALGFGAEAFAAEEVNVYSARKEELIKPMFDKFTAKTGIAVNFVTDEADKLIARLKSEGANSPADVFLTVDIGRIARAREAGLLQPIRSELLEANIPASLRDAQGYWFGLSKRARVIFYAFDRVSPEALSSYEGLADEKWRGRICIRSSNNVYNQSLVASLIAVHGIGATEAWASALVGNFARDPAGGDTDQLRAVAAGECDIALANTYYYGRLMASDDPDDREVVERVGVFFPNQEDRGVHVNVSGGGVTAAAPHRDNAVRLLEFLSSDAVQAMYAEVNHEFPVKPGIALSPIVAAWQGFREDDRNLGVLGELNAEAVRLMDRAGWQ